MNMTWIDRLQQWIESKAAYLAFAVLAYNIIMFILHIVDLSTGNNPNNIFRTTFALLCRLTIRLAQFWNLKKMTNQENCIQEMYIGTKVSDQIIWNFDQII